MQGFGGHAEFHANGLRILGVRPVLAHRAAKFNRPAREADALVVCRAPVLHRAFDDVVGGPSLDDEDAARQRIIDGKEIVKIADDERSKHAGDEQKKQPAAPGGHEARPALHETEKIFPLHHSRMSFRAGMAARQG